MEDNAYLEKRKNFRKMVMEYKTILETGDAIGINEIAEKYGLNEEPFLSDLQKINTMFEQSVREVENEEKEKIKRHEELKNTPKKEVQIFDSKKTKNEKKEFNQILEQETENIALSMLDEEKKTDKAKKKFTKKIFRLLRERDKIIRELLLNEADGTDALGVALNSKNMKKIQKEVGKEEDDNMEPEL